MRNVAPDVNARCLFLPKNMPAGLLFIHWVKGLQRTGAVLAPRAAKQVLWGPFGHLADTRLRHPLFITQPVGCITFVFIDFCHALCHIFACLPVAGFLLAGYDGAMQQLAPFPTVCRILAVLVWGVMALMAGGRVYAEAAKPPSKPLDIAYGANSMDINADGIPDLIVRARWENWNAHSFDRYFIMVRLKDEQYYPNEYYEVAMGDNGADYQFHTTEGADCLVVGYTFSLDAKGMLVVKRYMRDPGVEQYCEPRHVTITTYRLTDSLKEQGLGLPGLTPYYLKSVHKYRTWRKYEDVKELMK